MLCVSWGGQFSPVEVEKQYQIAGEGGFAACVILCLPRSSSASVSILGFTKEKKAASLL